MIVRGVGLGTTRRNTSGSTSVTAQPSSATRSRATAALICPPIGLVGFWKAGSSGATSAWVSTATARELRPARSRAVSRATASMWPMPPCESATASQSGRLGSPSTLASGATSSPRRRMNPTWGPLPWVTTTVQPSATSPAMVSANDAARSSCLSIEPGSPSSTRALTPIAIRTELMPLPRHPDPGFRPDGVRQPRTLRRVPARCQRRSGRSRAFCVRCPC